MFECSLKVIELVRLIGTLHRFIFHYCLQGKTCLYTFEESITLVVCSEVARFWDSTTGGSYVVAMMYLH